MEPLLLKPYYVSPVWGGPRIAQARGIAWTSEDNHGESFDVSAHPSTMGVVRNGPYAGCTLAEAIAAHHDELLGDVPDDAPLQITTMDAAETLSVQVHPPEAYAQAAEGDHGKVESWYILAAEPSATLIGGCGTDDVSALRDAATDDSIAARFGQRIAVQEGDFVLIPEGTMHALGKGIFAVEVGSLGNTTYRICDWGRGRQLHVDKAFDVLKTGNRPSVTHMGTYGEQVQPRERLGVDAGFFKSFVLDVDGSQSFRCDRRYAIITCIGGAARVSTTNGSVELGYTDSCLVPAAASTYTISGTCRVLRSVRTPDTPEEA